MIIATSPYRNIPELKQSKVNYYMIRSVNIDLGPNNINPSTFKLEFNIFAEALKLMIVQ